MPDARPPLPPTGPDIAAALSALPLETPERSAWPLLAERIAAGERARRPRARWPFAVAAAAVLFAVLVMPRLPLQPDAAGVPAPVAVAPATADPAALDALMAESAQLENLLDAVAGESSTSASATALALEFEAQLQRLDASLSDPDLDTQTRVALWDRRVSLLREFAGIQGTQQWLAAEGDDRDGELVAVF